jgi:hypothetical protein
VIRICGQSCLRRPSFRDQDLCVASPVSLQMLARSEEILLKTQKFQRNSDASLLLLLLRCGGAAAGERNNGVSSYTLLLLHSKSKVF